FLLSSFYLKFRDLMHIWGILTQMLFWLTPIIYPAGIIPVSIRHLFLLNPMARIIEDSRAVLIYGRIPGFWNSILSMAIILAILAVGISIFNKRSGKFAEEI
ncbi:MAG: ABC transporter permease, partial [Candidatus Margulisiibacteriota bacterium]